MSDFQSLSNPNYNSQATGITMISWDHNPRLNIAFRNRSRPVWLPLVGLSWNNLIIGLGERGGSGGDGKRKGGRGREGGANPTAQVGEAGASSVATGQGHGFVSGSGRPGYHGGRGGDGGEGKRLGGRGGEGEGTRMTMKQITDILDKGNDVHGGSGGTGGWGGYEGGTGGLGRASILPRPLWGGGNTGRLATLTVAQFCDTNRLSVELRRRLEGLGFRMAGALCEVDEKDLEDRGFNIGHIAELKWALKQSV
ncbi:hypothetical protein FB451DRAFT_1186654 [Mycena latifolia]|nr:hypothetical protein FB451DRAFT_1186654 [Mycena latifolia]